MKTWFLFVASELMASGGSGGIGDITTPVELAGSSCAASPIAKNRRQRLDISFIGAPDLY
jgi:hypothetical protein